MWHYKGTGLIVRRFEGYRDGAFVGIGFGGNRGDNSDDTSRSGDKSKSVNPRDGPRDVRNRW
jgi:hypothetical protein